MADIDKYKLSEQEIRKVAERDASSIMKNWEEGLLSTEEALQQFAKVGRETVKSVARMGSEFTKMAIASQKYTDNLTKQALQQQNVKRTFAERIGYVEKPGQDLLASQYRARQMAGGIESIIGGNFASGTRQILSTFPKVANFMGGPYYLALAAATRGLLKLDEGLAKLNKTVINSTGGAYSPFLNESFAKKFQYTATARQLLRPYKRQGEYEEILSAIGGNLTPRLFQNKEFALQTVASMGAVRTLMEGVGIDKSTADQLLFKIMKTQNLNSPQAANQLNNLIKFASSSDRKGIYSPNELIQKQSELYDRLKKFNIGMDSTARIVDKFSRAIEKGTISMDDFASYNKGMYEGDTGKLAGIGQQLIEYGQTMGLSIPKELLESSGNPLAVAWNMRKLGEIGNKDMLKLISSWMGMQTGNISGGNEAAAKEVLYSLIGPNLGFGKLSQTQVEGIVKGNFKNLQDAYVLPSVGGPLTGFSELTDKANQLIDKNTTEISSLTTAIGALKDELIMLINGDKPLTVKIEDEKLTNKTVADLGIRNYEPFLYSPNKI